MADDTALPEPPLPDSDAMYEALSFWFARCTAGQIEIGWRDPDSGILNRFKRFELDEIEELVTLATEINEKPGANIYFRVCTLKDLAGATTDAHFLQAPGAHIDHDDAGSVARLQSHPLSERPSFLVITGRDPETRGQTFWPFTSPVTDPALIRDINKRLQTHFLGDPAVVNPTRLMRLPGSIAWPVKPGRTQIEITELLWPVGRREHRIDAGALLAALPDSQTALPQQPSEGTWDAPQPTQQQASAEDAWVPPVRQGAPISALIDATRTAGYWHNSVLRLVASWINRGLSDREIHLMAPALTQPGYTVRQTHDDLQRMIESARQKWDIPDRDPFADAPAQAAGDIWTDDSDDLTDIPQRPWLVPGLILRGAVTLLSGQGAGGKSSYVVGLTTSMSAGVQYGKAEAIEPLIGINYNVEDDRDEQRRRYAAFLLGAQHIDKTALRRVIRMGPEGIGTLFQRDPDTGAVTPTQAMQRLAEIVMDRQASYIIVDPLAELHNAEENDNTAMRSILAAFRSFARETNAGVVVLHHDRKGVGVAGDVDRMRGASALQGAARIVLTLTRMTEEEAEALGIQPTARASYIRIDNAKANYTPLGAAAWYQLTSQTIANGESIAACLPWTPPEVITSLTSLMEIEILRLMLEAGPERCRAHHHSQDYAPRWLAPRIGAPEPLIKRFLDACERDGMVKIEKGKAIGDDRRPRPYYTVDREKFLAVQADIRARNPFDDPE